MFIEQPRDMRALIGPGRRSWVQALIGRPEKQSVGPGIEVVSRGTLIPPHRRPFGVPLESVLLRRAIAGADTRGATVVATTPLQWPAVAELRGVRRVFDCADDWSGLLPGARRMIHEQCRRIAAQADGVIVVRQQLAALFGSRSVAVVPNGTSQEVLATQISPRPHEPVIAYAGTLSERFDATLVAAVMERLAGWRMHIYGECRYARWGERPAPEFRHLLARFQNRITWHGPIERSELAARLDAAQALVLPHRGRGAITGDVMKLYDYAARGRPIVSTSWRTPLSEDPPPGVYMADTAEAFADAVRSSARESPDAAWERREWAEARSWERRWPSWAAAVLGPI